MSEPKKICIYGLGAIGGLFAARLACTNSDNIISAIARGKNLEIVKSDGLKLVETKNGEIKNINVKINVTENPEDLGVQDIVIICVKSAAIYEVAKNISPLLGEDTIVISAMNGIPFWFLEGLDEKSKKLNLDLIDNERIISQSIDLKHIIGSVVLANAAVDNIGEVKLIAGNRIIFGEAKGGDSPRLQMIASLFKDAGFDVEISNNIQNDIWFKLWGNMTFNPLAALCGVTVDKIIDDDLSRAFVTRCMKEAASIGKELGIIIDIDPEERHKQTRNFGAFKPSMLQDVEAKRPLELDNILGIVVDIARQLKIETPNLDTLFGLTRIYAIQLGLYKTYQQII